MATVYEMCAMGRRVVPVYSVLIYNHRSDHIFDSPSYEEILRNVSADRHMKTLLGFWTTTLEDIPSKFGKHLYQITLKEGASVLQIEDGELRKLYSGIPDGQEFQRTLELRELWKDYDMVWLDHMEQIFLKFDKINIVRISPDE